MKTLPDRVTEQLGQATSTLQIVEPLHAGMEELIPVNVYGYQGPCDLSGFQIFNAPFP